MEMRSNFSSIEQQQCNNINSPTNINYCMTPIDGKEVMAQVHEHKHGHDNRRPHQTPIIFHSCHYNYCNIKHNNNSNYANNQNNSGRFDAAAAADNNYTATTCINNSLNPSDDFHLLEDLTTSHQSLTPAPNHIMLQCGNIYESSPNIAGFMDEMDDPAWPLTASFDGDQGPAFINPSNKPGTRTNSPTCTDQRYYKSVDDNGIFDHGNNLVDNHHLTDNYDYHNIDNINHLDDYHENNYCMGTPVVIKQPEEDHIIISEQYDHIEHNNQAGFISSREGTKYSSPSNYNDGTHGFYIITASNGIDHQYHQDVAADYYKGCNISMNIIQQSDQGKLIESTSRMTSCRPSDNIDGNTDQGSASMIMENMKPHNVVSVVSLTSTRSMGIKPRCCKRARHSCNSDDDGQYTLITPQKYHNIDPYPLPAADQCIATAPTSIFEQLESGCDRLPAATVPSFIILPLMSSIDIDEDPLSVLAHIDSSTAELDERRPMYPMDILNGMAEDDHDGSKDVNNIIASNMGPDTRNSLDQAPYPIRKINAVNGSNYCGDVGRQGTHVNVSHDVAGKSKNMSNVDHKAHHGRGRPLLASAIVPGPGSYGKSKSKLLKEEGILKSAACSTTVVMKADVKLDEGQQQQQQQQEEDVDHGLSTSSSSSSSSPSNSSSSNSSSSDSGPISGASAAGGWPPPPPGIGRRCSHCLSQKTPQWRAGPEGPKTLCNACGVRFKSGRLFDEYRPAKSPSFSSHRHSNSHKKVMEMRRRKLLSVMKSSHKHSNCANGTRVK